MKQMSGAMMMCMRGMMMRSAPLCVLRMPA